MKTEYTLPNATRLVWEMHNRFTSYSLLAKGPLAAMLKDGGYPATESAALLRALDALEAAQADLEMALIMPLQALDE